MAMAVFISTKACSMEEFLATNKCTLYGKN